MQDSSRIKGGIAKEIVIVIVTVLVIVMRNSESLILCHLGILVDLADLVDLVDLVVGNNPLLVYGV